MAAAIGTGMGCPFDDTEEEAEAVAGWIADRVGEGVEPHEISVFVRSPEQLRRARMAVKRSGASAVELTEARGRGAPPRLLPARRPATATKIGAVPAASRTATWRSRHAR